MVVATKLMARRNFTDTGKQFNMIAASWIQFMIHDWIDHMEDTQQVLPFKINFLLEIESNLIFKNEIIIIMNLWSEYLCRLS